MTYRLTAAGLRPFITVAALSGTACAPERTVTEPAVSGPTTDTKGDTVLASAVGPTACW